jgi:tetratricopeptide (TPR) repeat protein
MKDDIIKMEEILEKYIEIEDNPEVYNIIGKSYLKNKKHEKAIEAFDLASERGNIDAFYYKALLFLDGNRERAGEYFEKYLNLSKQWIQKRNEEINRSLIPDQIYYKYKAINKYTLQMLIDDYLYFSDINTLNDPFDCRLIYEYNKIPIFKEVFKKEGIPKIMSLSKSNINNVLLWSHYTNNHQGICIGYKFNINELIKNEIILHSIRYVDEIYELENTLLESIKKPYYEFEKFFNTPATKNSLINSIIEKKDNWKYEDEVRLINFNQNKIFSKEAFTIAEIIFGCDTSDEDMITIINILYNKYKKDEDIMVKDNCIYSNKTKLIEFKKLKRSNDVVFSLVVDNDFNIEKYINWYITTTWS